jgi:hypothetical protein
MVPNIKLELDRRVHNLVKPLFRIGMLYAQREVQELLDLKRAQGFTQGWVRDLDAALTSYSVKMTEKRQPYSNEILAMRDFAVVILDVEPVWGRRWWNMLITELKLHGLLEYQPDPPNTTIPG